ncbi:peptide-N4-(N-acetyl-beta-glucosaminyl)asparagine amidase A-like [Magnolia sinica]|uniref:peptide-N4-(N-acetyl-beta- glucosaminyl)asparagine amidase A-like n=1 Tax=Magnolia sinica TaxID=86752 RepID=UPI00265AEEB9|nr:peptide-N4-(N-acetyl-beta-glucosaminyl)asparagine amidase A-like [Magnolia sinica]
MASSPLSPLSFLFFLLLSQNAIPSHANLQKTKSLLLESQDLFKQQQPQSSETPTTFFQVTKPISLPKSNPCSSLILQHSFAFTYTKPPVTAPYNPPSDCPSNSFSKIILVWSASCKGRQFDRIFGIWLSGVELLRSCTAEPRASGIVWTVEKDITSYSSLLKQPQTLAVYLGNLVDSTYTGVYHVNVTFHFYPEEETTPNRAISGLGFGSPADLILPISRNLPLNDGLWFLIENSMDVQVKEFEIPTNAYRAILEVFVSFHSSDEFWYGNPPNEYIKANNLTGVAGNGPFREVVITLDGEVVGAVWPFTVIYTGGINPLLWRPITGIGSFDLPTYNIEITPFLGKILDGKKHKFGFSVTDGLSYWYVDANLQLWLDNNSVKTEGELIKHKAEPFTPSLVSNFKGLNGLFLMTANRSISSTGWVKSSHGKITTLSFHAFDYKNSIEFGDDGNLQVVNQTIDTAYGVYVIQRPRDAYLKRVLRRFPLYLYSGIVDQGNGSYASFANISLGFFEDQFVGPGPDFSFSSLSNKQDGKAYTLVEGNLVVGALGSTQQVYKYESSEGCYFRNVSSSDYTILHDESREVCSEGLQSRSAFRSKLRQPFSARRVSLA